MEASADLERGREFHDKHAWQEAFECLSRAERASPLGAPDLELRATAAYMLGRDDDYVDSLKRAHQAYLEVKDVSRAVRCGFWIGHSFLFRGEKAHGLGWFARAQRLLENVDEACVEEGYLRIPVWLAQMGRGNFDGVYATAAEAVEIGERFGDADLVWLARDDQARALIRLGRVAEGLRLVDEALVAATAGDLSPLVTGIVYCNTIAFCRAAYEVRHVREWTRALNEWCERQPEMVAHNGVCLVHRAEILLLGGEWRKALDEARRSVGRFNEGALNRSARGMAYYCQGEALRLLGDFEAAEESYRKASQYGSEPQPGLSLMRLAQGRADAAAAAIRRIVGETTAPLPRAGLLPAYVEIMLAVDSLDLARAACRELDEISGRVGSEVVHATAAHCRGATALAEGDAGEALIELRRALNIWSELAAPYEIARARVLVGLACRALGDEDTAALEFEASRSIFVQLGASADQTRIDDLMGASEAERGQCLTARQLQVLRLIASGLSNRQIAEELFVSEHTVARHVQNIFDRLDVSSRTAATAFAFENDLF